MHIQFQQAINLGALLLLAKYTAFVYLSWPQIIAIIVFTLIISQIQIYLAEPDIFKSVLRRGLGYTD